MITTRQRMTAVNTTKVETVIVGTERCLSSTRSSEITHQRISQKSHELYIQSYLHLRHNAMNYVTQFSDINRKSLQWQPNNASQPHSTFSMVRVSYQRSIVTKTGKASPYSVTERRVPEQIPVLGSQPAGDVSHKPGGRLPLLSARPAVTPATLKRAATSFAAW